MVRVPVIRMMFRVQERDTARGVQGDGIDDAGLLAAVTARRPIGRRERIPLVATPTSGNGNVTAR
jgi:hypothetical protein